MMMTIENGYNPNPPRWSGKIKWLW